MTTDTRREIAVVPPQVKVVEQRQVYACRHCERHELQTPIITAPMPKSVYPVSHDISIGDGACECFGEPFDCSYRDFLPIPLATTIYMQKLSSDVIINPLKSACKCILTY